MPIPTLPRRTSALDLAYAADAVAHEDIVLTAPSDATRP
jgi:hypothetical protein